jgi:hypothetical protein
MKTSSRKVHSFKHSSERWPGNPAKTVLQISHKKLWYVSAGSSFSKLEAANYLTGVLEYWSIGVLRHWTNSLSQIYPLRLLDNSVVANLQALSYLDPRLRGDDERGRLSSFPRRRESRTQADICREFSGGYYQNHGVVTI